MKTNKETIKTYLEQWHTHGNSSNVFFEFSCIYSYGYHYILGKFLDDDLLIINDTGYSATTSKHIHLLRDTANELNINNYSVSSVELNSVYSELKYLETKLHKARKPKLWYNRIHSLYTNWFKFTNTNGVLIMNKASIELNKIGIYPEKAKDIQKIMLRVEQYYTSLTLNLAV